MNPEPKLAPPGAGLPLYQRLAIRYFTGPLIAGRSDWDRNLESFLRMNDRVLQEVESIRPEDRTRKVLVPSQAGLEDSSRYWSAILVLEHLLIVGESMRGVILALGAGREPKGKADTARVKPTGVPDAEEVLGRFRELGPSIARDLSAPDLDRNSPVRFHHPWFGPIRALQWEWLLQAHTRIHLQQLRAIKKGL